MKRIYIPLLVIAVVLLSAACGSSGLNTSSDSIRDVSKAPQSVCIAHADVEEVGYPSHVRLWAEYVGTVTIVKWEWRIDGQWYDATADGGVYWLQIDQPGTTNALLRGVDKDGNTCSSPIKIRSRNNYNAPPVVLFDGPQDYGEHFEPQADGTVLRYHEWFWDISRSYDPETSIATLDWGIYGGGDLDGDGIPDDLMAGKTVDGVAFSKLPGLIVKDVDDPNQFMIWVTPELTVSPLRVAVTATDTAAKPKRWGDGHVTLMK
jgi:hypothetical protein